MRTLLVANRSEIAIRCFRAATKLGLRTVTVYSYEAAMKVQEKIRREPVNHITAPMTGNISSVAARAGQPVRAGERLLSIEAMKMETAVYSPRDASVAVVLVSAGAVVEARDLLIILKGS